MVRRRWIVDCFGGYMVGGYWSMRLPGGVRGGARGGVHNAAARAGCHLEIRPLPGGV